MEQVVTPISKKLVLNIIQFKPIVKTNFVNKVLGRKKSINEFR
jgi:hypothetical protein